METPEEPVETPARAERGSNYSVLRNRDFSLYLIGRLVATIGQQMLVMAIGWEIYERTHSAVSLLFVGLTQVVPMFLLTLPAGHLADNYNRKKIIIAMTTVVLAASLGLTFASARHAPVYWTYVCLFVMGASRTFMWAASSAFLPALVERKELSHAVNLNSSIFQISSIVGPIAGGALIDLTHKDNAAPVYAVNAVTALIFCILLALVRRHHVVAVREKMTFKGLLTGFNFVFANRMILGIITLDMFAVLLGGAVMLLPIYATDILAVGPTGLGLLKAALPLGALLCTFVLAHRPALQKAGRALLWSVTVFGLATIGFGISTSFWLSFLMLFISGAADNVSVVVRHTLVQLLTPDEKRGRVSAVNNLFIGTSNELGDVESCAVAQLFGPTLKNTLATGAMISAVSGGVGTILVVIAIALVFPEIRKYGRLDA
ncbi:MAG: MFS transporter [Verrucomicrobiota bacterium]